MNPAQLNNFNIPNHYDLEKEIINKIESITLEDIINDPEGDFFYEYFDKPEAFSDLILKLAGFIQSENRENYIPVLESIFNFVLNSDYVEATHEQIKDLIGINAVHLMQKGDEQTIAWLVYRS